MADPFSVIGLLSATAGLLGFLVSTVEKVAIAGERATRCERTFSRYHKNLKVLRLKYKDWLHKWSSQLRNETRSIEAWGIEDSVDIWDSIKAILEEEEKIRLKLYGSQLQNLAPEAKREWQSIAHLVWSSENTGIHRQLESRHTNLGWRIASALYLNALLDGHLQALSDYIDHAESVSDHAFRRVHGIQQESTLSVRLINNLTATHRRAEDFWDQMSEAHLKLNSLGTTWSIVLFAPDEPQKCKFETDDDIWISLFRTEQPFCAAARGSVIEAKYFFSESKRRQTLYEKFASESVSSKDSESEGLLGESLKSIFLMTTEQNEQTQNLLRNEFRTERAKLALLITSWTATVWRSNWVANLCSCGMRYVGFSGSAKHLVFCMSSVHGDWCCDKSVYQRRHLLLGLSLTELALQQPVRAHSFPRRLKFQLISRFPDSKVPTELYDEIDVLDMVRNSTSRQYKDAVKYCFEMDAGRKSKELFTVQEAMNYIREAVLPLQEHFLHVSKQQPEIFGHRAEVERAVELLRSL